MKSSMIVALACLTTLGCMAESTDLPTNEFAAVAAETEVPENFTPADFLEASDEEMTNDIKGNLWSVPTPGSTTCDVIYAVGPYTDSAGNPTWFAVGQGPRSVCEGLCYGFLDHVNNVTDGGYYAGFTNSGRYSEEWTCRIAIPLDRR